MTTWILIRSMMQRGYEFQSGRHGEGLRGYWACFIPDDPDTRKACDECGEKHEPHWGVCGHAMTAHRAVVMAAEFALGKRTAAPRRKVFEP